jgi:hypothetical protein
VLLEGLDSLKISITLMGNRTRDLPTCSIVPQPITLPRIDLEIKKTNVGLSLAFSFTKILLHKRIKCESLHVSKHNIFHSVIKQS